MSAKDIIVKPIGSKDARRIIKKLHYSGKVVNNSTLHFGVFINGKCEGVMQFGSPMVKKNIIGMVKNSSWNSFLELNRMAFSEKLPRNSESRALSVAFRLIKKHYPHIKWVVSFADGAQCGDGTIYRASGFSLVGIKENKKIRINPKTGENQTEIAAYHNGNAREFKNWEKLKGFQLKYIYFINKEAKKNLTVPVLPFSKITEMGAGMYKGIKRVKQAIAPDQGDSGRASLTGTLQTKEVEVA